MRLSKTLERVGDYAETMSRAALQLSMAPTDSVAKDIEMMGRHASNILEQSIEAYTEGSVEKARATKAVVGQYGTTFDKVFSDVLKVGADGVDDGGSHPLDSLADLGEIALEALFVVTHEMDLSFWGS